MLNKSDVQGAEENIVKFKKHCKKYPISVVSALTGEGTEEVVKLLFETLKDIPVTLPEEDSGFIYSRPSGDDFEIERDDDGAFVIVGDLVKTLSRNVVLSDTDSMAYMQKTLRDKGVIKKLRDAGAKDGDTVVIGDVEFDLVD